MCSSGVFTPHGGGGNVWGEGAATHSTPFLRPQSLHLTSGKPQAGPLPYVLSPQGSLSAEADSAAWHFSLCRVLLGSLPSLEVAALLRILFTTLVTLTVHQSLGKSSRQLCSTSERVLWNLHGSGQESSTKGQGALESKIV